MLSAVVILRTSDTKWTLIDGDEIDFLNVKKNQMVYASAETSDRVILFSFIHILFLYTFLCDNGWPQIKDH